MTKKAVKEQEVEKVDYSKMSLDEKLFAFQSENIEILKSKAAYGYSYADLDGILDIVRPILTKIRIGIKHNVKSTLIESNVDTGVEKTTTSEVRDLLTTIIYNVDDPSQQETCETIIDNTVVLAKMNKFMVAGSAITYFRRYHIVCLLGLTTDEDSDAGGKPMQTKEKEATQKQSNPTSKPKGRAVESNQSDGEMNFVAIFDNLLLTNKTQSQLENTLKTYKSQMNDEAFNIISQKIIDKFK